ncbi:tetratricopeptide repeat protein [Fodinibius sp. AD559]|uniref:tetratricopeptide repeat protein n=1 Tax=Fodinibius sp. AD559 TaxID=3424179 RepID=UPI004046F599
MAEDRSSLKRKVFNQAIELLNSRNSTELKHDYLATIHHDKYNYVTELSHRASSDDDYKRAIDLFDTILEDEPTSMISIHLRGIAKFRLEKFEPALKDLKKGTDLDDKFFGNYYYCGKIYFKMELYKKALNYFNQALELDYNHDIYNYRGLTKKYLNTYDSGLNDFKEAIKINPFDPTLYYNRALVHFEANNFKMALIDFDNVLRLDQNYKKIYLKRGIALGKLGKHHKAVTNFDKEISFNPSSLLAYYYRGKAYCQLGEFKKALNDLNNAIKNKENMTQHYLSLAYKFRAHTLEGLDMQGKANEDWEKADEILQELKTK